MTFAGHAASGVSRSQPSYEGVMKELWRSPGVSRSPPSYEDDSWIMTWIETPRHKGDYTVIIQTQNTLSTTTTTTTIKLWLRLKNLLLTTQRLWLVINISIIMHYYYYFSVHIYPLLSLFVYLAHYFNLPGYLTNIICFNVLLSQNFPCRNILQILQIF